MAACNSRTPQQSVTGVAYVGPAALNIRKDLASKSAAVATAKHGEQLDVLETHRRFVKVRTAQGVEGWTDANLLLTEQQMDDLRRLAESASKLPSQGRATTFDTLNIHTAPARQSPSFFQLPEGGAVEVIGHRLASHNPPPAEPVRASAPVKKATSKGKGKNAKTSGRALPPPAPPTPPKNWQDLSKPRASDLPGYVHPEAAAPQMEDWSLVRTRDGKVGWVLSRMLMMAIPDEVAQYAEGHRITAYVPLGEVKDKEKDQVKNNWLWTTVATGQHPYEFDSFRVFVWSAKHHRYETAYIERNVQGYYPVETETLPGQDEKSFSVVLQEKDGKLYKRTYGFTGFHVRMISKTPYLPPSDLPEVHASQTFDPLPAPAAPATGIGDKFRGWRKKLFGK